MLQTILSVILIFSIGAMAKIQPLANDSPQVEYVANFDGKLDGKVSFTGLLNGSITVGVDLTNFPATGAPFMYHVHEKPVPTNGNCTATGGHLNPFGGNINATNVEEKEIGDLSGRYSTLNGTTNIAYVDEYLSLNPESQAFIGNLSVVVHLQDNTRYACANLVKVDDSTTSNSSNHSNHSISDDESSAGKLGLASISVMAGVAAALLI